MDTRSLSRLQSTPSHSPIPRRKSEYLHPLPSIHRSPSPRPSPGPSSFLTAHRLTNVLDDMVSVLSSRTGRQSPIRSPAYLNLWRGFGLEKPKKNRLKYGKRNQISREIALKTIYVNAKKPRNCRNMFNLLKFLGFDFDFPLFSLLISSFLHINPENEVKMIDWISLFSPKTSEDADISQFPTTQFALISKLKEEIGLGNLSLSRSFETWYSLIRDESGEMTKTTEINSTNDLYGVSVVEITERMEKICGKKWKINEQKHLILQLLTNLQRFLYKIGALMYIYLQKYPPSSLFIFFLH